MRKYFSLIMLFTAVLAIQSCSTIKTEKVYRHGAVVCAEQNAARVGLSILKSGGNAIDAACATAFALAVTYPRAGNIGGGGFVLVYSPDSQKVSYLDFRETAPSGAAAELYLDSEGKVDRDRATLGPLAAGTPGTVAGLYELHQKFGKLAWSDVVESARQLAASGFVVQEPLFSSIRENAELLNKFEATRAVFLRDGKIPEPGDVFRQKDLAVTLELIAANGRDGFYRGETAEKIAAYCDSAGGRITIADLAGYQPVWRDPVKVKFRGYDVCIAGLPSSGGVVLGQILKILEHFDFDGYTPQSPYYLHCFTEAERLAFADREKYLGDPAFVHDYTAGLLDDAYINSRVSNIATDRATPSDEVMPGLPKGKEEADNTTHLVTADSEGNVVSMTYTINLDYGCKAVVPGCGFLLNNEMDDFAIAPGQPNAFGLVGGEANMVEPGKRMLSSMSPTIVLKNGQPYMALGSPGGSKIISAVGEALMNYITFGENLTDAVNEPRFHHQWLPDKLYLERGAYKPETIDALIKMGHDVVEREAFSEVMAIAFSADGMYVTAAADKRGHGSVAGF